MIINNYTRENMIKVNPAKTHIAYCRKCGEYGHELPRQTYDIDILGYWLHQNCGGEICVSTTTTHDMLDDLNDYQKEILLAEISKQMAAFQEECRRFDARHLQVAQREIAYRNRYHKRNDLLPESIYKRALLTNPEGVPYCPNCDSLLVQPIRAKKRFFSVGIFGLASDTIGKTMECLSCKYKW